MNARTPALTIAVALVAVLLPAASAQGKPMEVAMQDDLTVILDQKSRDLALIQFYGMGGTHVRMTFEHSLERKDRNSTSLNATRIPLRFLDRAVDRVREFGLTPQVTLFWKDQEDPKKLAAWMSGVVDHFGTRVNRYSVLNESDLYLEPLQPCTRKRKARLAEEFPRQMVQDGDTFRAKVKTSGETIPLARACERYERGRNYRRIYKVASRAIRDANPRAQILAGETSALRGLDWFFRGAEARKLRADGWAHHPFQFTDLTPQKAANNWGIGNLRMLRRAVRMPVYLTEFAYPHPDSRMDRRVYGRRLTDAQIARALPRAWATARRGGAKQMLQFQWYQKFVPFSKADYWDTALLDSDDSSVTPQYFALRDYICGWSNRC